LVSQGVQGRTTSWNAVTHFAGGRAKCDLNIKTCGIPDSSIQLVPSINFDHLKCRLVPQEEEREIR
jgi:hypothetical protein